MTLGLAIAPWQSEGRPHSRCVGAQALREPTHFRSVAARQTHQPSIELPRTSPVHEPKELPREAANLAHHGFDLAKRLHEALVVRAPGLLDGELAPRRTGCATPPART